MHIIVKKYEGYNSALGKYISSKREYDNEMAKGGFIPYEEAQQIAKNARERQHKEYKLSKDAKEVINTAINNSDSKGNVRLSDRLIDGMKKVGVSFYSGNIPKHYQVNKGGFDNATP